jgi:DNA-binding response OmpR family regulator
LQDILSGAHGPLSASLQRQLEVMLRNAKRLLNLINQLLDISKLEAREMTLDLEPTNLVNFTRRCVLSFASWADRKNIALGFQAETDALSLNLDPDKMEKVLNNLLSNAFKNTGEKGKILVSIGEKDPGWAHISVKDTGKGIHKDQIPLIFNRFHQVPESKPSVGTGIGLSLVQELVTLHEGEISVASEEGFGSEFTVRLPRTHKSEAVSPRDMPEDAGLPERNWIIEPREEVVTETEESYTQAAEGENAREVVLIVEDYVDLRMHLRGHLEPRYTVLEAEDGQQGIQVAREKIPDLVISDVMMPNADGYTLCRTLKQDERTSHIPIILLTAKASDDSKIEGLEIGADDYLVKPFDVQELLVRVQNLIDIRKKLSAKLDSKPWTPTAPDVQVTTADEAFLNKVSEILEQNISNTGFGVYELADEVGFSRRQFLRKIRALTGHGPADFIRRFRLDRAAALLEQQAGTVAEIAYAAGFKHPAHFTALFREKFGKTPSEYSAGFRERITTE